MKNIDHIIDSMATLIERNHVKFFDSFCHEKAKDGEGGEGLKVQNK